MRRIIQIEGLCKKSVTLTDDVEWTHEGIMDLTVPQTFADERTNTLKIVRVTEPRQTRNTRTLETHVLRNAFDASRCGLRRKQNVRRKQMT